MFNTYEAELGKLKGKAILDCFNVCPLEGVYHI